MGNWWLDEQPYPGPYDNEGSNPAGSYFQDQRYATFANNTGQIPKYGSVFYQGAQPVGIVMEYDLGSNLVTVRLSN